MDRIEFLGRVKERSRVVSDLSALKTFADMLRVIDTPGAVAEIPPLGYAMASAGNLTVAALAFHVFFSWKPAGVVRLAWMEFFDRADSEAVYFGTRLTEDEHKEFARLFPPTETPRQYWSSRAVPLTQHKFGPHPVGYLRVGERFIDDQGRPGIVVRNKGRLFGGVTVVVHPESCRATQLEWNERKRVILAYAQHGAIIAARRGRTPVFRTHQNTAKN